MFSRIRVAFGVAFLLALITSITVFAKGNFSFISITGPNLKEAVRSTDPALTTDFLAFFDFSEKTEAPANPGPGYEVTRYYVDGSHEDAFDRLHYYPESGFVYYDGIVNVPSEYGGKWYAAKPEIKTAFENALPGYARPVPPTQPLPTSNRTRPITLIAAVTGLMIILLLAFRFRRPATH